MPPVRVVRLAAALLLLAAGARAASPGGPKGASPRPGPAAPAAPVPPAVLPPAVSIPAVTHIPGDLDAIPTPRDAAVPSSLQPLPVSLPGSAVPGPGPAQAAPSFLAVSAAFPDLPTPLLPEHAAEVLEAQSLRDLAEQDSGRRSGSYVEAVRRSLFDHSRRLVGLLRSEGDYPYSVDALGIGGGPINAMFFANLRRLSPNAYTMVMEAGDRLGTFDRFGDSFFVNSGEARDETGNPFRGAPAQVRDFNRDDRRFVSSKLIGDATVLAHHFARSNVVFGQRAETIEEEPHEGAWPGRYRVESNHGLSVYADQLSVATGMGDSVLVDHPTEDLARQELDGARLAWSGGDELALPRVQTVDDALARSDELSRGGVAPAAPYEDKVVVVVGAGDGGKIAVEMLLGLSPNSGEPGLSRFPRRVVWLGQAARTGAEFRESEPRPQRYGDSIGAAYESGLLQPVPGRLLTVRESAEGKALDYVYRDAAGRERVLRAEAGILALGYRNRVLELFRGLAGGSAGGLSLEPVVDRVRGPGLSFWERANLGLRLKAGGREHDIFVIGAASGLLPGEGIEADEAKARPGGLLDLLGARSERVAELVAAAVKARPPADPIEESPLDALPSGPREAVLMARVEIARLLSPLAIHSATDLYFELAARSGGGLTVAEDIKRTELEYLRSVLGSASGLSVVAETLRRAGIESMGVFLPTDGGAVRVDRVRVIPHKGNKG